MYKFSIFVFFIIGICLTLEGSDSSQVSILFNLKQFDDIAIATDLEPDDVLALGIIFKEANAIYALQTKKNYPIKLIIVGQSNSEIKKLRMENLLRDYFDLPPGVQVNVVAGKSTQDRFPFENIELDKASSFEVKKIDGVKALENFISTSQNPFIIQIKPAQELFELSFEFDLAHKATILFYGNYNLWKTIQDPEILSRPFFDVVRGECFASHLQLLLDHFSTSFSTIGILESDMVLGKEAAVFREYPWTDELRILIEKSKNPFLEKFKAYVFQWNQHLLNAELQEIQRNIQNVLMILMTDRTSLNGFVNSVLFTDFLNTIEILADLTFTWNDPLFNHIAQNIQQLIFQYREMYPKLNPKLSFIFDQIEEGFHFVNKVKPTAGLQFTLADVAIALSLVDTQGLFSMSPVDFRIDANGHFEFEEKENSSVYYYHPINKKIFAETLKANLMSNFP